MPSTRTMIAGMVLVAGLLTAGPGPFAQDMTKEEFTDEDFAQFFGLIEDGKITPEKMNARCAGEVVGFTFLGNDLVHSGGPRRIEYNTTGMKGSVDGRVMRSRHYNVTFGEWTGAALKPLCPGLWSIQVNFTTGRDGAADAPALADDVRVHVFLRTKGEKRPGHSVLSAVTGHAGAAGSGGLSLSLPLRPGDEITTYSEAVGTHDRRILRQVTFTAQKLGHLPKYVEGFDDQAWKADLEALRVEAAP